MTGPNTPGNGLEGQLPPVPPPPPAPADVAEEAPVVSARPVPRPDDVPTAPFTPVLPARRSVHAPIPPAPDAGALPPSAAPAPAAPASGAPSAPPRVQRVSAAQRIARSSAPSSPFAAAAPQPARPMPGWGIPLQQVPTPSPAPDAGAQGDDWFTVAAAEQAAATQATPAPAYQQPTAYQQPAAYQQPTAYAQPAYAQPTPAHAPVPPPPAYAEQPAYAERPAPAAPAPSGPTTFDLTGAGEQEKRRKGRPALVAIGAAVVVIGAIIAFNTLRNPSGDAHEGATTASSAKASDSASQQPSAPPAKVLQTFASPSSNITCTITTADVTCNIATLARQPAPVDTCQGTVGYRVTITDAGEVVLPCVPPAEQPKPAPASMQKIPYGQKVTQGKYTCTSADTGMSCKDNETGKGFNIAKAGIVPS